MPRIRRGSLNMYYYINNLYMSIVHDYDQQVCQKRKKKQSLCLNSSHQFNVCNPFNFLWNPIRILHCFLISFRIFVKLETFLLIFFSFPLVYLSILIYFDLFQVAMTYSVELFLCMVVGLVAGHAIFNTAAPVSLL